jgi:hypothetical protein
MAWALDHALINANEHGYFQIHLEEDNKLMHDLLQCR